MTGSFAVALDDLDRADLRLRRSWPRAADHLLLDLDDPVTGRQVAGQWFADPAVAASVAAATDGARSCGRVVVQPHGGDRKLTALAPLLRLPGARLVAHRPERRAVVALDGGLHFAKVVPARRLGRLRHTTRRAAALPIRTPTLVPDDGPYLTSGALPGTPLPELLAGPRCDEALRAVGEAVARLHATAPPAGSSVHGPGDELAVTEGWERWARSYGIPLPPPVAAPLPVASTSLRLIHRDLHDGQFLLGVDAGGRLTADGVGLLDFDLMAAGDPALDLANLVEHLLLRGRQGVLTDPESAVEALLSGYRPDEDTSSRVISYRALSARRLAAVYAFRATDLVT